jgi:hypothetical protein
MVVLDQFIKSKQSLNYNEYIEIIYDSMFKPYTLKWSSNKSVDIPNLYKFCFDILIHNER